MGIRAATLEVNAILGSLSIVQPKPMDIKKVYVHVPREGETLNSTPAWISTYTFQGLTKNPGGWIETTWDIRMQLAVKDANQDSSSDIATAFMDEVVRAFSIPDGAHQTLNGSVSNHELTGGSPTLVGWTWAGGPYVGLDLHLTAHIKEVIA